MIRVFTHRTKWTPVDDLAFVGDPPMFRPSGDMPVRISCVFTWDIPEAERLKRSWSRFYSDVQVGGPAYGDPGGEFEPGRFVKPGVTFTSRGCIRSCPWCFVPSWEGRKIREIEIKPGYIVQDNNLLACSRGHVEAVFKMLSQQRRGASFNGGIDARLLRPWHRELFESIRIHEIWTACDSDAAFKPLQRSLDIIGGIPRKKRRCYVLIGYNNLPRSTRVRKGGAIVHGGKSFLKNGPGLPPTNLLTKRWCRPQKMGGTAKSLW